MKQLMLFFGVIGILTVGCQQATSPVDIGSKRPNWYVTANMTGQEMFNVNPLGLYVDECSVGADYQQKFRVTYGGYEMDVTSVAMKDASLDYSVDGGEITVFGVCTKTTSFSMQILAVEKSLVYSWDVEVVE